MPDWRYALIYIVVLVGSVVGAGLLLNSPVGILGGLIAGYFLAGAAVKYLLTKNSGDSE